MSRGSRRKVVRPRVTACEVAYVVFALTGAASLVGLFAWASSHLTLYP